jgi:hypothetical protein
MAPSSSSSPPTVSSLAVLPPEQPSWLVHYGAAPSCEELNHPSPLDPWQRPQDWLPLPPVAPADQKFVGLVAIYPNEPNRVCIAAAGSFHVIWGDGHSEAVISPSPASEEWNLWSSSWDPVQRLDLNLSANDLVVLNRLVETLQVRLGNANTQLPPGSFQLQVVENNMVAMVFDPPASNNGNWFSIEIRWRYTLSELVPTMVCHQYDYANPHLAGSESARGYRQAIVTLTPQQGQTLSALSLQDDREYRWRVAPWLDVAIAAPALNALKVGPPLGG